MTARLIARLTRADQSQASTPGAASTDEELELVRLDRRRAIRAFDRGAITAVGVGVAYGLLHYPVDLTWGLIAVGIGGGWLIGWAVTAAAWGEDAHLPDRRLKLLGAALGLVSWLVAMFVAYVMGQALLQDATLTLLERLSLEGFGEYVGQTYALYHALALAALTIMAWRTAR